MFWTKCAKSKVISRKSDQNTGILPWTFSPQYFPAKKLPASKNTLRWCDWKKPRLCVRQVSTTSTPSPSRSLRPKWKSSSPLFLQFSSPFDEDKPLYLPTALFKSQSLCDQIFDKKHTTNLQSLRETNFLQAALGESKPRRKLSLACDIKSSFCTIKAAHAEIENIALLPIQASGLPLNKSCLKTYTI